MQEAGEREGARDAGGGREEEGEGGMQEAGERERAGNIGTVIVTATIDRDGGDGDGDVTIRWGDE